MNDALRYFPQFEIAAFKTFKDLNKAVKKETGKACTNDGTKYFCITVEDSEFVAVKSFILVTGYSGDAESIGLLCHEVSHSVDGYLKRIEEKTPGTEVRAYLMQAAMLSCMEMLGGKNERN